MSTEDPSVARAAGVAALGHSGPLPAAKAKELEETVRTDADARVRAAALGALVRAGEPGTVRDAWAHAASDEDPAVRRRAADLGRALPDTAGTLITLLDDPEVTVVVAAAESLGELAATESVAHLARTTTDHPDPLAREAAVAALGALGDQAGLEAILAACTDKPPVRRRAVLALAPFEGKQVEAALKQALEDNDWQVRQAAEDLTTPASPEED